jgi:hypothetical protein
MKRKAMPVYNVILWDERDRTSNEPSSDFGWFTFLQTAHDAIWSEVEKTPTIYRYEIVNRIGASVETWTR